MQCMQNLNLLLCKWEVACKTLVKIKIAPLVSTRGAMII